MKRKKYTFLLSAIKFCYFANKYINKHKNKRRWWVRPLYAKRSRLRFFETTFQDMKYRDEELFFKYTRMNLGQYNLLLSIIQKDLQKHSKRKAISPECRLAVTLVYLSQGVSRHYLAWSFRMGVSTVREIICEVCEVLWKLLSPVYMSPFSTIDWLTTTKEFEEKWQMPNCIGSVDGKHVKIKCPPNSGSQYFNYKGHFSIVLMGVCDANYTFISVDVGAYGSQSDGGVFRLSKIGKKLFDNDLLIPPGRVLANSNKKTPLYFVGDNAFPLRPNLMRPYPGLLLEAKKDNFNMRLSRARRVIENTFGILCTRWRILLSTIEFHPQNADKVILTCTVLHNFVNITAALYNSSAYNPKNYTDRYDDQDNLIPGQWREQDVSLESVKNIGSSHNSTREAVAVRETLADFFWNENNIWTS